MARFLSYNEHLLEDLFDVINGNDDNCTLEQFRQRYCQGEVELNYNERTISFVDDGYEMQPILTIIKDY